MAGAGARGRATNLTAAEAGEVEKARERMIARHRLIEAMILNNERQLKNESARGGAQIERACALRDAAQSGDGGVALEALDARLKTLEDEHNRLVLEREWLNASLLEFESGPSDETHNKAGHA